MTYRIKLDELAQHHGDRIANNIYALYKQGIIRTLDDLLMFFISQKKRHKYYAKRDEQNGQFIP